MIQTHAAWFMLIAALVLHRQITVTNYITILLLSVHNIFSDYNFFENFYVCILLICISFYLGVKRLVGETSSRCRPRRRCSPIPVQRHRCPPLRCCVPVQSIPQTGERTESKPVSKISQTIPVRLSHGSGLHLYVGCEFGPHRFTVVVNVVGSQPCFFLRCTTPGGVSPRPLAGKLQKLPFNRNFSGPVTSPLGLGPRLWEGGA